MNDCADKISDSTPLPKDMATFWPSNSNKALLEKLVYMSLRKMKSNYHIVIGQLAIGEEKWQCMISHGVSAFVPYMTSQPYFEEADLQIVLHVSDSISSGYTYITVLSNDTDVIVVLLYHACLLAQRIKRIVGQRRKGGHYTVHSYAYLVWKAWK